MCTPCCPRCLSSFEEMSLAHRSIGPAPENQPPRPQLIGTKVYDDFPLEDVLEYIDWNPFFQVRTSALRHTGTQGLQVAR